MRTFAMLVFLYLASAYIDGSLPPIEDFPNEHNR